MSGSLFVIAAPSGAGKTSLVKALVATVPGLRISVSHTTRAPRDGEAEGVDYFFVAPHQFQRMVETDALLEHATVFGRSYGTSRAFVERELAAGTDVILEIDWQGARTVRRLHPAAISIFILPPSLASLRRRLESRGKDDNGIIEQRMAQAQQELSHYAEFDYLVVNDDFTQAIADLTAIIHASRLGLSFQRLRLHDLLQRLGLA
ncbi:MAG: guanylate kinase [Gammaproteobacteria bacterium]|nr:guanylate kinase [Gammaproteobacteria bacterium]